MFDMSHFSIFFIPKLIMQYFSTANIDNFIRPFVYCAVLFVMATSVRKTFTTDVGQMQRRRHHMTVRGLIALWFV